ncbi:MAG: FHA domain-containing protein, partial [bacterium]
MRPIGDFADQFSRQDLGDYLHGKPPAVLIHDAMAGSFKPASGDQGDTIARIEARFTEGFDAGGDELPEETLTPIPREVAFMAIPLVSQHDAENRQMIVGRTMACDIQIDDVTVSRRHAVIERRGEDYLIRDLGSTV